MPINPRDRRDGPQAAVCGGEILKPIHKTLGVGLRQIALLCLAPPRLLAGGCFVNWAREQPVERPMRQNAVVAASAVIVGIGLFITSDGFVSAQQPPIKRTDL